MNKSNADYAVECAKQLSRHEPCRSTLIFMAEAIRDLSKPLPQLQWVGLTDDDMLMIYGQDHEGKKYSLGRMVQQALKEKNT